jgi:hypothetical protein
MPAFHKLSLSFNAGELSPFLVSRTDIQKYESGCQKLENFIILPYGGVIRRPGTVYKGKAKFPDKPCRLIGFNFSVTTNFILEFGHLYIRFWTNGVQVVTPIATYATWVTAHAYVVGNYVRTGTPEKVYCCKIAHTSGTFATDLAAGKWAAEHPPLEVVTPYTSTDVRQLQYTQINDLMYIVHPNYQPAKLTRNSDTSWTFAAVAFKWPPLGEENIQNIQINTSGTSGAINLHSTGAIWAATDVGSTWQIGHAMAGASQTWTEVALGVTTANSPAIRVRGPWSLITYGTWHGEVRVVRTIYRTNVTETIRTYYASADGQRNISTTGTEDEDCSMYIAFITGGSAGSSTPIARLEFSNAKVYGLVNITGYSGPQDVSGTVAWGLARTDATPYWSKAAFSVTEGYPRTVCLHDQRLIYGGTKRKPLSFHGSQIDDYDNFQRGVAADAAFLFNIAANESNPIQWMVSQTKLLIGTAGDEWAVGSAKEDEALGAGNVQATQQSSFGSSYMQSKVVNEVVLFAQRQGKKIRELTYSFEKDGWVAPDLTILASHIGGKGFVEMAFCQQPDAILWTITQTGELVGMTYERDQNVVGWHRHSTDGTFESVGTIYGGQDADEVWFCVKRTIGGVEQRYIERFDTDFRVNFDEEDKVNYIYLDAATRATSTTEETTVSGLDYLEGKSVGILGDGANQPERTVVSGAIELQEPVKVALVGLPYKSIVRPMNLNIPNADTMQGRSIRIHQAVLRLYKSLTCKFSSDDEVTWDEIFFRDRVDMMDASPKVFTGDKEISTGAGFSTQQAITLMQDRPFPLCVLAEILWCNFYGH